MLSGSFYRSSTPTITSDVNNENLNKLLTLISSKDYSHQCLVGDFNFKDIIWVSWTNTRNDESKEFKFIETVRDCYLHQHNEEVSRRRGNDEPSNIDLIFTDEALQVSDIVHHPLPPPPPLGKSDHDVITFNFNCYLNYHKTDYSAMRQYLELTKWKENYIVLGANQNVEEAWNNLKTKLMKLREKFVPKKIKLPKPSWNNKGSFPIDKSLQDAIRNKRATHRQWMSVKHRDTTTNVTRLRYVRARNKVKTMMRQAKLRFERDIAKKSKGDPKVFWSHIRHRLKTESGVAPLYSKTLKKNIR